jgi:uncharacterized DUF497 family protein
MNKYDWDENKRQLNLEKHGIDFIDAADIFLDLTELKWKVFEMGN